MTTYKLADMGAWVNKCKLRQKAVAQKSIERVGHLANLSREKGGRMPVVIGTLRGSFVTELNGQKVGEGEPDIQLMSSVGSMEIGDTFRFGWTVIYAARVNLGFVGEDSLGRKFNQSGAHFVEFGTDQWQTINKEEAAKAQRSVEG